MTDHEADGRSRPGGGGPSGSQPTRPVGDADARVDRALAALQLRRSTAPAARKTPTDKRLHPQTSPGQPDFTMRIDGTTHTDRQAAGAHLVTTIADNIDGAGRAQTVAWLGRHPITASTAEGHVIVTTADNRIAAAVPASQWPQCDGTSLVARLEHQTTALDRLRQHLAVPTPRRATTPTLGGPGPALNL